LPYPVRAAQAAGVPDTSAAFLSTGDGDELQRAVFYVFGPGCPRPAWVVKVGRRPGYTLPFERDEQGLELARTSGPAACTHAPSLLVRGECGGSPFSVETAGGGRTLYQLLVSRRVPTVTKLKMIDGVAGWIVDMGVESAGATSYAERQRLRDDVLPSYGSLVRPDLVDSLAEVPGVLQHGDLGSWNIVTDGPRLTAVDWESARPGGLPLWDLLYFLADALVVMQTPAGLDRLHLARTLFRGDHPQSGRLFGWTRRCAASLHLTSSAVGAVATLCWLHHGLSAEERNRAVLGEASHGAPPRPAGHLQRLALPWLKDPQLGPTWPAWRQASCLPHGSQIDGG
jgi:hypothetical protein